MPTAASKADSIPGRAAAIEGRGAATAAAAWPTGVSLLAQVVDACRRSGASSLQDSVPAVGN